LSAGAEVHAGRELSERTRESDRLLGEPLQATVLANAEPLFEASSATCAPVELGGRGARDQRTRSVLELDVLPQMIAADDPAGRMQDVEMSGAVVVWIERTLDVEGATMLHMGNPGALRFSGKMHLQLGAPFRLRRGAFERGQQRLHR
jgi:hypothetical protein